jgi:hypothetical protein
MTKPTVPDTRAALKRTSYLEKSRFNRKFLLKLFSSPYSLAPFLIGCTDLLVLWAFNISSASATVAGAACVLGSLGIFLTRLAVGKQELGREVLDELRREADQERDRTLDELDRKLSMDGDPRTEKCLRDLRTLDRAFRQGRLGSDVAKAGAYFDVLTGVEQLFDNSVLSLEKTLELWYTAAAVQSTEARAPILAQRERIIEDVNQSTRQLGSILGGLEDLGADGAPSETQLAGIRRELDQGLEVARKVAQRMKDLDRDLGEIGDADGAGKPE